MNYRTHESGKWEEGVSKSTQSIADSKFAGRWAIDFSLVKSLGVTQGSNVDRDRDAASGVNTNPSPESLTGTEFECCTTPSDCETFTERQFVSGCTTGSRKVECRSCSAVIQGFDQLIFRVERGQWGLVSALARKFFGRHTWSKPKVLEKDVFPKYKAYGATGVTYRYDPYQEYRYSLLTIPGNQLRNRPFKEQLKILFGIESELPLTSCHLKLIDTIPLAKVHDIKRMLGTFENQMEAYKHVEGFKKINEARKSDKKKGILDDSIRFGGNKSKKQLKIYDGLPVHELNETHYEAILRQEKCQEFLEKLREAYKEKDVISIHHCLRLIVDECIGNFDLIDVDGIDGIANESFRFFEEFLLNCEMELMKMHSGAVN